MSFPSRFAFTLILSVSLALPALAQGPGGGPPLQLLEFDGNADGKLTRAEFSAGQSARFSGIDANSDGFLSRDEHKVHSDKRRQQMEAVRLQRLDANADGKLSDEERAAGPGKGGEKRGRRGGDGAPDSARMFDRMDADKDGRVSLAEMSTPADKLFAEADANKDNAVTVAELQAVGPRRKR